MGRDALRAFVAQVLERTPPTRRRLRRPLLADGALLMWDYPRRTADGEQLDLVEAMEVEDGLIRRHRVSWGWLGAEVLEEDGDRPGG